MRRQILLIFLPIALGGFAVSYLRMVFQERRIKKQGGSPTRPRAWRWIFGTGLVVMVVGAVIAWLDGLAAGAHDGVHSALTGTFMLFPGLLLGIGIGFGRWLGSRTVWRRRAKGLR